MTSDVENTNRGLAVVFTVGYHVALFLILFFVILKTPIPPLPEAGGGGLEVNFGNSEQGFGDNQSEELIPVETRNISASTSDDYITQDQEQTASIVTTDKKNKVTTVIKINDPVVDQGKLYKKKSSKNPNQGIAGGSGNQGKENGDVNSGNYKGDGGRGNGDGNGDGTGVGPGNGPGTSFDLKGRKNTYLPKPAYDFDEQGKVVVTITVDKTGKVTKAIAGTKGTTVTDKKAWKLSEQAAYKAKFDAKADAAIEQKGTITYIFLKRN